METITEVKKQLLNNGHDPEDFTIEISQHGSSVTPKWFYEYKQIAKTEDKPIIRDVNDVAGLTTMVAMDKDELAEMLVYALIKIDELEAKING